jgi:hypothetical protein
VAVAWQVFKMLRGQHKKSIASSVCFACPRKGQQQWELISGGLDSTLVHWDFSRGRPLLVSHTTATEHGGAPGQPEGGGQLLNPPLVPARARHPQPRHPRRHQPCWR